jgi:Asp-tRNA(Asn)/Glu-tRNA(Gln) amidotransferase A subunit family amidase
MSADICYTPAVELRSQLADRTLSARELMEALLERIEDVNPALNAVVSLRAEDALAEADVIAGPLHGLPVTIKDLTETADLPTTYCCRAFAGHRAGFDAVVVSRLREAGAIVVGKTNSSEFGLRPTTENSLFGPTSNPWSLEHNSGGSSGGAAAATAAGISPLALGGDGGGSCRIPASCCGVVGLKPTRGRVPLAPASYEAWGALVVNGPIARTVRDVAMMLDVIAGPIVGEPYGVESPEATFLEGCEQGPVALRVGYQAALEDVEIEPEILTAFDAALHRLESLGHELVEVDVGLNGLRPAYMTIKQGNTAAMLGSLIPDESLTELESNTLAIARRGLAQSAADYCLAIDFVRLEAARIMQHWAEIDVLATPTLTKLPLRHGVVPAIEDYDERWRFCLDWHSFTFPFNITGQPAISLPSVSSDDGLPIGIQLVGRTAGEAQLLALAAAYEEAASWQDHRPGLAPRAAAA